MYQILHLLIQGERYSLLAACDALNDGRMVTIFEALLLSLEVRSGVSISGCCSR